MRNLIEYTLVSLDGVFAGAAISGFSAYRDEAYMRDGLAQALACDALLMGRTTYEDVAKVWPRRTDPWADRINAMSKYIFSSTLEKAEWANSTIVRGDVVDEVTRLKQQERVVLRKLSCADALSLSLLSDSIPQRRTWIKHHLT